MSIRKGPTDGYDFGNKRQYRRRVWRSFVDAMDGIVFDKHALLMPSSEGAEVEVALDAGFRQPNLHVVDRNKAIVATLKRRFPMINTYGCDVQTAAARIAATGTRLSVANLDFTGCLSGPLLAEIANVFVSGVMSERGRVAITLLRGREQATQFRAIRNAGAEWSAAWRRLGLDETDIGRVSSVIDAIGYAQGTRVYMPPCPAWKYRSIAGSQTMLVLNLTVHSIGCMCEWCRSRAPVPLAMLLRVGLPGSLTVAPWTLDLRGVPHSPGQVWDEWKQIADDQSRVRPMPAAPDARIGIDTDGMWLFGFRKGVTNPPEMQYRLVEWGGQRYESTKSIQDIERCSGDRAGAVVGD